MDKHIQKWLARAVCDDTTRAELCGVYHGAKGLYTCNGYQMHHAAGLGDQDGTVQDMKGGPLQIAGMSGDLRYPPVSIMVEDTAHWIEVQGRELLAAVTSICALAKTMKGRSTWMSDVRPRLDFHVTDREVVVLSADLFPVAQVSTSITVATVGQSEGAYVPRRWSINPWYLHDTLRDLKTQLHVVRLMFTEGVEVYDCRPLGLRLDEGLTATIQTLKVSP